MNVDSLLKVLHIAEKLKDTTRHSYTSNGRHESVTEHTFRLALMAYFMKDEFPEADIDKVIKMCLLHDMGEAFTGDIPAFEKTSTDLSTWSDNEYEVNLTYAEDKCDFSPYLRQLRTIIKNETVNKIE